MLSTSNLLLYCIKIIVAPYQKKMKIQMNKLLKNGRNTGNKKKIEIQKIGQARITLNSN